MKKLLISFLLAILSISQLGFTNKIYDTTLTDVFENPNELFCNPSRVDGVYKCSKEFFAFDTSNTLTIYMDENSSFSLETIFQEIETEIDYYDQLFDSYESYDDVHNVFAINQSNGPLTIDRKLFDAIQYALDNQDVLNDSDQLLFNIGLQPVLSIWHDARYSENCVDNILYDKCPIPSDTLLNGEYNTNPDDIILNEDNLIIEFSKENMGIDLGGFAKGYISMILQNHLDTYENISYILNLGASNVLVGGENISNPNATSYGIGLTKPSFDQFNPPAYGVALVNSSYSVVTSGSYQRYIKNLNDPSDDKIYHHIIDPSTNYPGGDALAVSIITRNTAQSDILSTAIFLMDYDQALAFVNETEDLEAVWYFNENDIRMSENAGDFISLFDYNEESNNDIYYIIGASILGILAIGITFYIYKKRQIKSL